MHDCAESKTSDNQTTKCCADAECDSGLKNRYFKNKRLTPESFQVEQAYESGRRHLLNRAIHGWGVVYGFKITAEGGNRSCITIGPGLALDPCGRELLRTAAVADDPLALKAIALIDGNGQWIMKEGRFNDFRSDQCLLLRAHYAEQCLDPVRTSDSCHCDRVEWFYACETVQFSLTAIDCKDCCLVPECELKCTCSEKSPCDDAKDATPTRGGRCLCEYLTDLNPDDGINCKCLTRIKDDCGIERHIDIENGVPLACIRLGYDNNDCRTITVHEVCVPRRLVKRNDLLFDLIRGCDLTHIDDFGWKDWHRRKTTLDEFRAAFGPEPQRDAKDSVSTRFWVTFSRPVRKETVRADCFAITVLVREHKGSWWEPYRVPITGVELTSPTRATIVTSARWVRDEVYGSSSELDSEEVSVEIEVRGDFILDCNGQAVDANAVGDRAVPTGNGTPGGTLLSTFRVAPTPTTKQGA